MAQRFDIGAFVNAWNTQQVDRILEFYSEDAEIVALPNEEPYRGKEGVRRNARELFQGIEDMNLDVAWSSQEGDKVAVLFHASGKHTGPLPLTRDQTIPATNKDVRIMGGLFCELDADGKIRRETDLVDVMGLLMQVGAMPEIAAR